MVTAIAVVTMYIEIVLPPILDSFFKSDSEATPVINEDSTRGTAISFNRLINIFPNGDTQLVTKAPQPWVAAKTPNIRPRTRPIMIFQCNSSFIIFLYFFKSFRMRPKTTNQKF